MYKVEVKLIFIYCHYKKRIGKENCVKGNAVYNFYGQKFTMCVLGIELKTTGLISNMEKIQVSKGQRQM